MVFGKTSNQHRLENQQRIAKMVRGVRTFAWLPTKLGNGQWCWLQPCYRYYHAGTLKNGDLILWERDFAFGYKYTAHLDQNDEHITLSANPSEYHA